MRTPDPESRFVRRLSILVLFVLLAACGRDGPPQRLALTGSHQPAVSAVNPTLGPSIAQVRDAVALWDSTVLWHATETWNAATADNERRATVERREAQEAERQRAEAAARPPTRQRPGPLVEQPTESTPHASGSVGDAIAHWFPSNIASATRVANCESTLNPGAVSAGNLGLFQINATWSDEFPAVTGQPYRSGALNAWYNAQFAAWLYRQSGGWGPWSCRWAA